jgi:hypothetical protein
MTIGRMYFASPAQGERFYLRLLLTVVPGATSWEDLRTFEGTVHQQYKDACMARGLLDDDGEWRACLQEAGDRQPGQLCRMLFAVILLNGPPTEPHILWEEFCGKLCDDLAPRIRRIQGHPPEHPIPDLTISDYGLYCVNKILMSSGRSLRDFPPMPLPALDWGAVEGNPVLYAELDYREDQMQQIVDQNRQAFNPGQSAIFDEIIGSVTGDQGHLFFIHSAGGCGKTFLCNTIAAEVRRRGEVALCVASSGIAALLLAGGRTAHSRFRIPIPAHDASVASIPPRSDIYEVIQRTKVIIWDEIPMQNRYAIESVDRGLRDARRVSSFYDSYFILLTVSIG